MESPSPSDQYLGHFTNFIQPIQLNQLLSDTVEKAGAARKTRRRRTSGCKIKANAEFGIEDCRTVSNECMLQPGDTQSKESPLKGKPVPRDTNENTASSSQVWQPDVNPSSSAGTPAAGTTKNPIGTRLSHQNLIISPNNVAYLQKKIYSSARRKLGRQLEDDMLEVDVNMMIWGTFMSATMKAAVHLGQDDQGNLRTTKNTDFEKGKQLFDRS